MHTISLHLLNYLIPLTLIWMRGLCVSSVLLAHLICNNFRRTWPSPLHASTFLSALKFTHRSMHTWLTVHRLISGIYIQKLAIYSRGWESTAVPAQPASSVICIAGRPSERLSLSPNANELGLWGFGRQPGLLAEEKSIRLSIASKEPLSTLLHYLPESPTSYISILTYMMLLCIWWIQFQTSVNIHTVSIFVLALIFIYKTAIIGFLM